ncbi:MAG: DUF192 domain-containing protein [Treponema sp.]|nr:DUF192 domain-containing protein [Treponema sp.]
MRTSLSFKQKVFLFLSVIELTVLSSCSAQKLAVKDFMIQKADGSQVKVSCEMAVKPEERNFGFMERKHIPDGTGMLFVFENDQFLSFWMKNTPHPLSIAYIDSSGRIRDIFDMTPFSLQNINSTVSVRYALEVPQGWFKKNRIKTGDKVLGL